MKKICFNKGWQFAGGKVPFNHYEGGGGSAKSVDLPHDFMIEQERDPKSPNRRDTGYFPGGRGDYSKAFFAPEEWRGQCVCVEFEGVYMNATVKLNGNVITRQNYGYTSFYADLGGYLKYGEDNLLTVTVDNSASPNSRWYTGSGIYRYAWLHVGVGALAADNIFVKTLSVKNGEARVSIEAPEGSFFTVTDAGGNQVVVSDSHELEIANVKLWDIDSPYLYKLTVSYGGDSVDINFGVRTFSVDAENGLILNGRKLKLKGGCVHHDNGILGAASYARSEERKIELLKASGYNAVRTAHNPPSPAFLDACDRLGMICMDEAFDQWRCAKTQFDYHVNFDSDWEHDIASMVRRDRNHPSILFWSIGNEIVEQMGGSGAAETSRKLAAAIRAHDGTRPVGMAYMPVHGLGFGDYDPQVSESIAEIVAPLDFVGYNYMWRIYGQEIGKYPGRVIIGTETFPKEAYATWDATLRHESVIGDFVWTAIDYLGEAALGRVYYTEERPEIERHLYDYPWNQAYCGDIDVCGFKRPQSYYRDILWGVSDKPKMFVRRPSVYSHESEQLTFWGWNDGVEGWDFSFEDEDGKELIADVYSPAKSVRLYLNGELVGEQDLDELKASFRVAYKKGELKAVDSNGNEVILASSKAPAKIKLMADRINIKADGDLAYVTVEIADEDGRTVTNAVNRVYFAVEGAGKLIAAGSSNPKTEEKYSGNWHSAYDGKLMAVVKSTGAGEIILNAIADGLKRAEARIVAE